MVRTPELKRYCVAAAAWSVVVAGAAATLFIFSGDRPLRLANIAIPVATLIMLWIIWLRQRRIAKLTEARLEESADVYARVAALSDALEEEYLARRVKSSLSACSDHSDDGFQNNAISPTIH